MEVKEAPAVSKLQQRFGMESHVLCGVSVCHYYDGLHPVAYVANKLITPILTTPLQYVQIRIMSLPSITNDFQRVNESGQLIANIIICRMKLFIHYRPSTPVMLGMVTYLNGQVVGYQFWDIIIFIIFTIWGCVSSAYPILLWWSRECVLYLIIIIKPEVWIINHCLGLGHETMVCAVCLTMFLLTLIN